MLAFSLSVGQYSLAFRSFCSVVSLQFSTAHSEHFAYILNIFKFVFKFYLAEISQI